MKNLFSLFLFTLILGMNVAAQEKSVKKQNPKSVQTEFTVNGVCGMCEKRIEKAALIKGVKMADWDKMAQKMNIIYNSTKVSLEDVQKAIADAGHDTEIVKATDEKYNELPACCAYRSDLEIH